MNIFITGVQGFIGSHLAQHLANDEKNNIYGLYRSIKHESTFYALDLHKRNNINLIQGNINEYNRINEIINDYDIDNIYHLASKVIVQNSVKMPTVTFNTNVIGTFNILESIRINNREIPTYIMSSDKAYGSSVILPYTEDLPLNGSDVYSASKACADIMSRSYAYNYDLPIVIGRPSNVYGFDFNWTRLIPTLAKSCFDKDYKETPLILNEGSYYHMRDYTYVNDVIEAIELLIKNINKTKGEAYNISSNFKNSTYDIVDKFLDLCNMCDKKIEFKKKDTIFKEIQLQSLNSNKLIKMTGWSPKYNLDNGLKETINKYKKWYNYSITFNNDYKMCYNNDYKICYNNNFKIHDENDYRIHDGDNEICKQKLG